MARRSTQPRELVRLSPLQFSLSVSIVVVLLGAAGLAGYFYGLKQAARTTAGTQNAASNDDGKQADPNPVPTGTDTSVTFYSALTEPRKDVPAPPTPRLVKKNAAPADPEPAPQLGAASEIRERGPGVEAVMLQVASYKDQVPARKLLHELSSEGYAGTVVRADLGERGVWFRVRMGPYGAGEEAEQILKKLRDERKLKGYVVKQ